MSRKAKFTPEEKEQAVKHKLITAIRPSRVNISILSFSKISADSLGISM